MTSIATWNVNSIKARLPNVLAWLKSAEPDVVLLQELKCIDDNFPRLEIEEPAAFAQQGVVSPGQ